MNKLRTVKQQTFGFSTMANERTSRRESTINNNNSNNDNNVSISIAQNKLSSVALVADQTNMYVVLRN